MSRHMVLGSYLAQVQFLVGVWQGAGKGKFPTIGPFAFGEELTFESVGKPFLAFHQKTWNLDNGALMHIEVRPVCADRRDCLQSGEACDM